MIAGDFAPVEFNIRCATMTDIGAMALLLERANARRDGLPLTEEVTDTEKLAEVSERMVKLGAWACIADGKDRMAGFVLGHPSSEEETIETDPRLEYLALLMAEPTYWGKRVGSMLLDVAADKARDDGKEQMVLWTAESNKRARGLYEHKGYQKTLLTRISRRQGPLVHYLLDL